MEILVMCSAGIAGFLFGLLLVVTRCDGFLRVDMSDPGKDLYLLEIKTDLDKVNKKKHLILKVDTKYVKPQ